MEARHHAAAFSIVTAAVLASIEVAGRAVRDAYFLSELPLNALPAAIAASALLALGGTLALSAWLRRRAPERVAPLCLFGSGVFFALLAGVASSAPRAAALLLYLYVTGLVPVVLTAFWSLINERFDPFAAKAVVARVAAAVALGGVAGGLAADRSVAMLGMPPTLLVLAALSVASGGFVLGVASGQRATPHTEDIGLSGFQSATRRPLLRQMALLMFAVAVVETVVDYALKVEAAAAFADRESLVRFFAIFYTGCGLLGFLIQAALGDRFLRRFGLAAAVAMLPLSVAIASTVGALGTRLWGFVLARGAETVASVAFFRSGFQLLYTPIPAAARRPAKAWVDVASGSAGEVVGAVALFAALAALPGLPSQLLLALAAAGSLGALLLVFRLHRSYVQQLGDSLRRGRVRVRAEEALDKTTALTIAETQVGLDRDTLLEQAREHAKRKVPPSDLTEEHPSTGPLATADDTDPSPGWIEGLTAADPERVRRVLQLEVMTATGASEASRRKLVAWVIPLLEDNDLAPDARHFLSDRGERIAGQLVDALLDPEQPPAVRREIASVLGNLTELRAMSGVWLGTEDSNFEIREACARAAARIASRDKAVTPSRAAIDSRVAAELAMPVQEWSEQGRRNSAAHHDPSVLLSSGAKLEVNRSVEHVFTLLAIAHGRELMASALVGLISTDPTLRGTALEYLESALPLNLSRQLFERLDTGLAPASERTTRELEEQLLLSTTGLISESK